MEALLYFALWAGLIVMMMRFGYGTHVTGRGRGRGHDDETIARGGLGKTEGLTLRWVPSAKGVESVYGRTVATDKARSSVYAGSVYEPCFRECRKVFKAAPDLYLGSGRSTPSKLEHSHA